MTKKFQIAGIGSDVQFGKGGARIIESTGVFQARNADNSGYARIEAGHPTGGDNDVVTLKYLEDRYLFKITYQIDGTDPEAGAPANGEVGIVTTAGGGYSLGEVYNRVAGAWVAKPLVDGLIGVVTVDLTGGTDEYEGEHDYKYDAGTTTWIDYGVTQSVSKVYKRERGSVVFGSAATVNIGSAIPTDARITRISFNVTTVFDGAAASVTIGDGTTADRYADNDDIDLSSVGLYVIDVFDITTGSTQIEATYAADGSTTGAVDIEVEYSI